jgi:hypothetical protein
MRLKIFTAVVFLYKSSRFGQKPTFRDYLCVPSSGSRGNPRDECVSHLQRPGCNHLLDYLETLMMGHKSSPETLVSNQEITPRKNPKASTQHVVFFLRENFASSKWISLQSPWVGDFKDVGWNLNLIIDKQPRWSISDTHDTHDLFAKRFPLNPLMCRSYVLWAFKCLHFIDLLT